MTCSLHKLLLHVYLPVANKHKQKTKSIMTGLRTKLLAESQWKNTDLFRSNVQECTWPSQITETR